MSSVVKSEKKLISFASEFPQVAKQWHPTKNGDVTPKDVKPASNTPRFWICNQGHTWQASPKTRRSSGCPYCSNRLLLTGFNDLATTHPELAAEWHPTKNGDLTPQDVIAGGRSKVEWLCPLGHNWKMTLHSRSKGHGCLYCSNKKILVGFNDLATTHPELAAEWHPTKNGDLTPQDVVSGATKKVWWKCSQGHEWIAKVSKRKEGTKCLLCDHNKRREPLPNKDLATTHPKIAAEWHPTLNLKLTPFSVSFASNQRAYWLCSKDDTHVWETYIHNRTRPKIHASTHCPYCASGVVRSKSEQEIFNLINDKLTDKGATYSQRHVIPGELDIYVPQRNIAIEFNGIYWHSEFHIEDRNYHAEKSQACAEKGIHLIHVWEDDWRERRDIVVRAIAHRLNATERLNEPGVLLVPDESLTQRYGARTLSPEVLTHTESAVFLEANHIQGKANGTIHTGLRDREGILRAVFVAKRVGNKGHEGEWRIERYATRGIVPGGFTKLMKFTQTHIQNNNLGELSKWVTFSDGALSDGSLYRNYGFVPDAFVRPDYMYVVRNKRVHKFNYRLKRFRDDPNLKYEEGLSERELALLNNIPRIWDSGKTRWVREIDWNLKPAW